MRKELLVTHLKIRVNQWLTAVFRIKGLGVEGSRGQGKLPLEP